MLDFYLKMVFFWATVWTKYSTKSEILHRIFFYLFLLLQQRSLKHFISQNFILKYSRIIIIQSEGTSKG